MNKIIILTLALLAFSAVATPSYDILEIKNLWDLWKNINSKVYTSVAEEARRFEIFYHNYFMITIHNQENKDLKLALNKFADLTDEEFQKEATTGGFLYNKDEEPSQSGFEVDYSVLALPERWDWREHGAVNAVKNQAKCGSCWAFSATGALEGFWYTKSKKLLSFSEQQLVDCVTMDHGCQGGLPIHAFAYTAKNGIELESDYPYEAKDGQCRYNKDKAIHVNDGFTSVKIRDAAAMKAASVVTPVSVGVRADQPAFRFYKSGVVKAKDDCSIQLNHGVLVVGYEKSGDDEAFLVKNSWGGEWGDKGYIRISTDPEANYKAGVCGILLAGNVPKLNQ